MQVRIKHEKLPTMYEIEKFLSSRNPQEREYALYWLTSFGIQSVVDLKPTDDLMPIISRHIKGEIDIRRTRQEVHNFYHELHQSSHDHQMHRGEEADKVAVRIVEILLSDDFELSVDGYCKTHHHLFHGIYHHSGEFREKPFSKKEWVLGNTTILYPKAEVVPDQIRYIFDAECAIDYAKLSPRHQIRHYCRFIAKLLMLNAFHYANSRAVFVYALSYLLSRGYHLQNDTFYREAWYFRNAIIRACYTNMHQGIYPTTEYMEMFLGNLLLGEDNELKNHRMVIRGD